MILDGEQIIGKYLRGHDDVKALQARVVGEQPSSDEKPWVRITQFDAPAVGGSRTDHLIAWMGQFDCYAGKTGGQEEASALTRTVRAALNAMPDLTIDGGVITGVQFTSCPRLPDEDFKPARQRYALSATVWMHP